MADEAENGGATKPDTPRPQQRWLGPFNRVIAVALTLDFVGKLGPVGMLVFVEAVAWFLLRQYRAHVDDFKTTHGIGAKRLDFLMALRLLRAPDATTRDC